MEVFRFGLYVLFPVGFMAYFGAPEFFEKHVKTINFWPPPEKTNHPPTTKEEIEKELERMKAERWQRFREAEKTV